MFDWSLVFIGLLIFIALVCGGGGVFLFRRPFAKKGTLRIALDDDLRHSLADQQESLMLLVESMRPVDAQEDTRFRGRMGCLATSAPRSAIIKGWRELENAAHTRLQDEATSAAPVRFSDIPERARESGLLQISEVDLYRSLRRTRDLSFSFPNDQIDSKVAEAFLDGAEMLLVELAVRHTPASPLDWKPVEALAPGA